MNKKYLQKYRIIDIPLFIIFSLDGAKLSKNCLKYIFFINVFFFHVIGIYTICISVAHSFEEVDFKMNLAYLSSTVLVYTIRYLLVFIADKMYITIELLKFYKRHFPMSSNNRYTVYVWLSTIYCTPLILTISSTYLSYRNIEQASFFSFGIKIQDMTKRNVLYVIGNISYYSFYMQCPSVTVLSICLLINSFDNVLIAYKRHLKNFKLDSDNNIGILKGYFHIMQSIIYLKNMLSFPLLLIIINSFFNLYTALAYFLKISSPVDASIVLETASHALTACVILICLTFISSRIPEKILDVKMTAGTLIQRHKMKTLNMDEVFFLLDRIEKSETVYLTAGGMIDFQRSFLLTAFGTLFTYGLLIFNIQ